MFRGHRDAGGGSYLGGGTSGYAPVPRYEAPDTPTARTTSPAPAAASRTPRFKTGGMKLGSKKTRQAELLDALGGEVLTIEDMSVPLHHPCRDPERRMGKPSVCNAGEVGSFISSAWLS